MWTIAFGILLGFFLIMTWQFILAIIILGAVGIWTLIAEILKSIKNIFNK
jgi:hypothetical protein